MANGFRGYAQSRGFKQRDPGYGSLARQREQDNQVIRDMKESAQDKMRERQQYIDETTRVQKIEAQNRADIKNFEDKAWSVQQKAKQVNAEIDVNNARIEGENAARFIKDLGAFSDTLVKQGIDFYKAKTDADKRADFVSTILNDLNAFAPTDEDVAKEVLLDQGREQSEQIGDSLNAMSLDQSAVQQWRRDNPALKVDQLDFRIQAAVDEVKSFNDYYSFPEQTQALIQKYDLYNVNRVRLFDLAKALQAQRSALYIVEQKVLAKDNSDEVRRIILQKAVNLKTPQAFNDYYYAIARGTQDGQTRNGYSYANEFIFGKDSPLANPALVDDSVVQNWLDSSHPSPQMDGQTWRQRYPQLSLELLNERSETDAKNLSRIQQEETVRQSRNFRKLQQLLNEQALEGQLNYEAYDELIETADVSPTNRTALKAEAFRLSFQGVEQNELIQEIEYNLRSGAPVNDTEELVRQLFGPDRAKYIDRLNKERSLLQGMPVSEGDLESEFKATLRNKTNAEKVVDVDTTYLAATAYAMQEFRRLFREYSSTGSPEEAFKLAKKDVLERILGNEGVFAIKNNQKTGITSLPYFGTGGDYYKTDGVLPRSTAINLIKNDVNTLDTRYIVSENALDDIYKALTTNMPYRMPGIFQELERRTGLKANVMLQRQLDYYATNKNQDKVQVPLSWRDYSQRLVQNDPRAQMFLNEVNSQIDYRRSAIIAEGASNRNPRFMSSRVGEQLPYIQVEPAEQGLKGLSAEDYRDLAFIVSGEAQVNTDDEYAVAASVLNRLAINYGGATSIKELGYAPGQYSAVTKDFSAVHDPELAKKLASPEGQRKIRAIMEQLEGRTQFKGQKMLHNRGETDPMFSPQGNFYHYSGQTPGSGPYTGPINRSYERFFN